MKYKPRLVFEQLRFYSKGEATVCLIILSPPSFLFFLKKTEIFNSSNSQIFLQKFHRLVLGLVRLIDAKLNLYGCEAV